MEGRRTYITKSKSGHYTVTVKQPGYAVKAVKLASLDHARLAVDELNLRLDRLIVIADNASNFS